jgi:uncharacterized protein YjbI with pentapeptide repeats
MTNKEQLKILLQGSEIWNKWRHENTGVEIDLSGVNLSESNLRGADLSGTES